MPICGRRCASRPGADPVAASHVDLWATDGVLDLAGRERKAAWIVLNRTRAGTRLGEEVAAAAVAELTAGVVEAKLAARVVYAETLGQGLGAVEGRPSLCRPAPRSRRWPKR